MSRWFRSRKILVSIGALFLFAVIRSTTANPQQVTATQPFTYPLIKTSTVCVTSASPTAACSSAPAGFVAIPPSGMSLTVDTTAVTPSSQIFVQFDVSLAGALGGTITCNPTPGSVYWVSARNTITPSFSFTVTTNAAPSNSGCFSYFIVN